MVNMEGLLKKWMLAVFWAALLLHCLFQYLKWPYVAVTKPILVPMLLTYLMIRDQNIGRPIGKFIFYVGMFLALFGDVLLISINDTFFLSGMIAFMLMNLCYAWSFTKLQPITSKSVWLLGISTIMLILIAYFFYDFMAEKMGTYAIPVLVYMFTVSLLMLAALNIATGSTYRSAALWYFIPGAFVFLVENAVVALNRFHYDSNKDVYIGIMFAYGLAQFLFAKGIKKTYLHS